jgi:hypothetical protein
MATLEELSSALVKADAAGNADDAKAFADAIRQMRSSTPSGIPETRKLTGAELIPGQRSISQAEPETSFLDKLRGVVETPFALAANLASGPITYLAGAGGPEFQKKVSGQIQYQPRTQLAQQALEATGRGLEATKLPPFMGPIAGANMLAQSVGPASRAVGDLARSEGSLIKSGIAIPLEARAARIQEGRVAGSYANAPIIDAAKAAERTGLAVNPAITNPTIGNRTKGMVVGSAFDEAANKYNAGQTTNVIRKDLGIAPNEKLDVAAIDRALDEAAKPYAPVRAMPVLQASDDVLSSIQALDKPATLGGKAQAKVVTTLIDDVIQELQAGRSGEQVIDDIRQMRRQAQSVYKARDSGNNPPPADIAQADARIGIANALEKLIDENAPNAKVLKEFQQARQRMAQIYDHERAVDFATGSVDPQVYAKLLQEKKGNMTGVGADIGKVAATFPNLMSTQAPAAQLMPKVTRSGLLGATGALLGGAVAGYPGAIGGASLGGASGFIGSRLAARGMTNPAYQASRAMPTDYRPAPNMLRPVEPNMTPNALVPYDYSQQIFTQEQMPNFVLRPGEQGPLTTPGVAPGPAQIGMAQGPVGGQMGALRMEDARIRNLSMQQGAQAEAQAAAAAAAGRQSTGRGSVLEFDPITGTYKVGGEGVRGATPEIFMSDTGRSLNTATQKIASRQNFALSAEERVAWEKTKVDLAAAVPELKGLSDKAIAGKIMDREWASNAVAKARQQAQAFDEIAQRGATDLARRAAAKQRDLLVDALTTLEEQLRPARPVSSGRQGPKTIEALRKVNKLAPDNQNGLAP